MGPFILAMAILSGNHGSITSFTAVYGNKAACEAAAKANRERISSGTVILATCTSQT